MDYILNWKLGHRSEEDMGRLFRSSKFNTACHALRFEPGGINLFAQNIKQG